MTDARARRSLPNSWTTRLFEAAPDEVFQLVEKDSVDAMTEHSEDSGDHSFLKIIIFFQIYLYFEYTLSTNVTHEINLI